MTLLDFNELREGQQVGIQTTDRGVISGIAVPSSAGSSVTIGVLAVGAGDRSFNGDGSGGAQQLSTITTLTRTTLNNEVAIWTFQNVGMTVGSLVFFAIEGFNNAVIHIDDNDTNELVELSITNPTVGTQNPNPTPFPGLVFTATGWTLLQTNIHGT